MLSLKILLLPEFLSLHSGIGYGVSDLGHYTNINIGCILGFENKYIVPFIYFGTYYGMPINPKSYDLSLLGDDQKGEHLYTPTNTTGILYNVGLKLPIGLWISNENDLSLYGSFGSAQVADERMDNDFLKIGIGIEIHLITKECKK